MPSAHARIDLQSTQNPLIANWVRQNVVKLAYKLAAAVDRQLTSACHGNAVVTYSNHRANYWGPGLLLALQAPNF